MNNLVSMSRDDDRIEAASRWVLRIDEAVLTEDDKARLGLWLDEDPKNHDVLLEVAAVWDKVDVLARLADFFPHEATDYQVPPVARHRLWAKGNGIAACLVLLAIIVVMLLPRLETSFDSIPTIPIQLATYETVIGEQKTVLLPDGSEIVLNTNSEFSQTFTPSARVLHLVRGEIIVRVAKEDRPLSVIARDRIVQAKGTEFVVEITKDHKVDVIVTEGSVAVGDWLKSAKLPGVMNEGADSVVVPRVIPQLADNTLSAGEEVVWSGIESVKKTITPDEIEAKLSWKERVLIFRSESLEQVLREVERYTTIEFVVLDASLNSEVLTGRFRTGDVETLLVLLEENFNIRHEFLGETHVMLSSM